MKHENCYKHGKCDKTWHFAKHLTSVRNCDKCDKHIKCEKTWQVWQNIISVTKCEKCDKIWQIWIK